MLPPVPAAGVVHVTVSDGLVTAPTCAVTLLVPVVLHLKLRGDPLAAIVPTAVLLLVHVAIADKSCVELSLYVPVAISPILEPVVIVGELGLIAMDTSVGVGF